MAKKETFTNQPNYDPAGKGLDYGGDGEGTGDVDEKMAAAAEQGYFGHAAGDELDGDLTVQGVANRDVAKEQAEAREAAKPEAGGG